MVVTAGRAVARYSGLGWVAALPGLQQHRNWHGCGAFVTAGGEAALLVAGGWDTPNLAFLDSAEVLVGGAPGWVFTTPLPRPLAYPRAVSFDNRVLLLGGGNRPAGGALQSYPDVLVWEAEAEQWVKLGAMLQPRLSHAAATIELTQELLSNCS